MLPERMRKVIHKARPPGKHPRALSYGGAMRIARALAIKAIFISSVAGAVLSGPAMALSVATTPSVAPVASAVTSTPNMYHT